MLKLAAAAGLTALAVYVLVVGKDILLPLVIAFFAWYLINALATYSRRLRIAGRTPPTWLRFGVAIAIVVLLGWFAVQLVIGNLGQLASAAPRYEQNLRQVVNRVATTMGLEELPDLYSFFTGQRVAGLLRGLAGTVAGIAGMTGTVALYVVFLLLEQHSFDRKLAALFPDPARRARADHVLARIGAQVQHYIWLKTLFSFMVTIPTYIVMRAVGLDMAELWALVLFALNFIPYIGAWLGVIIPTLLAAIQFGALRPVLWTLGLVLVLQLVTGNLIEPRIMGKGLNLSPVVILLSLAFWGTIWGIAGMFVAVPLMVILMIVCSHVQGARPVAVLMSATGELET